MLPPKWVKNRLRDPILTGVHQPSFKRMTMLMMLNMTLMKIRRSKNLPGSWNWSRKCQVGTKVLVVKGEEESWSQTSPKIGWISSESSSKASSIQSKTWLTGNRVWTLMVFLIHLKVWAAMPPHPIQIQTARKWKYQINTILKPALQRKRAASLIFPRIK